MGIRFFKTYFGFILGKYSSSYSFLLLKVHHNFIFENELKSKKLCKWVYYVQYIIPKPVLTCVGNLKSL
jgi:hypothetical protein